jgi:CO/xanthine dehydrogenase Mo-binding subunit
MAKELGIDAAEFRLMNFLSDGETDAVGQELKDVRFREVLQGALDAAGWKKRKKANHGRGIALSGRHISGGDTGVILSAEADGDYLIVSPSIDQGSGTHTILRQLVADRMKIELDHVRVVIGDTDTAPRDGGMRASRMTYVAGNAMMRACDQLQEKLLTEAARMLECRVEDIDFDGGKFSLRQDPGQQVLRGRQQDALRVDVRRELEREGRRAEARGWEAVRYAGEGQHIPVLQVCRTEGEGRVVGLRSLPQPYWPS